MTQERHPSTSAERDRIKEEASVALRRALTGRSFRPELFLGTRESAGKALLDELAPEGEALGFLVSRLDVGEETFAVQIFREGRKILSILGDGEHTPEDFFCDFDIPDAALANLFEEIGRRARSAHRGWLLTVENMDRLSQKDLTALIAALHRIAQTNLPVVFLGSGLPKLARMAGNAKSYAERLFLFNELNVPDGR